MAKASDIEFKISIDPCWTETFITFNGHYAEFNDMASYIFVDAKREMKVVKYFVRHQDGIETWPVYHRVNGYASMTFMRDVMVNAHSYFMGTNHSEWGPSSYEYNRITKKTKVKYRLHDTDVSEEVWFALRGSTLEDFKMALELMETLGEGVNR